MDLRKLILAEHSKAQTNKIVKWVGNSQERFDQLMNLFLMGEYRVTQRAGWPLGYCVQAHPLFIRKHFSRIIRNLEKPGLHDAVKRNTVRLLQAVPVPKRYEGTLMNICFSFILSPAETVAVKAFSMTILETLSRRYPEIRNELKLTIEERWAYESAAFKTRAQKILKAINKNRSAA